MKIKKWIIGIFGVILSELLLILIFSAILPVKMVVKGGSNGTILSSAIPEYSEKTYRSTRSSSDASGASDKPDSIRARRREKRQRRKAKKIYAGAQADLVLVNREHQLDSSYDAALTPICSGRLYASAHLCESLVQMLADAKQQGWQYWIASAYRSREKQQRLVDEDVRLGMNRGLSHEEALQQTYTETMPAGHSEHETGLALDILCSDNTNMDISQAQEPANIWLKKNCHRYGFVLRYPREKEAVTGISYEPWHFRYVGKKAAAYMTKHNLTLEEFWDRLN